MKVQFKNNIKERIIKSGHAGIVINNQYYPDYFGKPDYFEVVEHTSSPEHYFIRKPMVFSGRALLRKHMIPYTISININLDESLFEWSE